MGLLALVFLLSGCFRQETPKTRLIGALPEIETSFKMETITSDGVRIVGDYYSPKKETKKAVLLLHMMPADRSSWKGLAGELVRYGFSVLAIDLRGHGNSMKTVEGKELDYKQFTDGQHQESIKDVEAAADFLIKQKGFKRENILLAGASIGANLALQYLSQNPQAGSAVLMSPGLDYRGIKTEPLMVNLAPTQRVLIVAGRGDEYAYQSSEKLYALAKVEKKLKVVNNGFHGTELFEEAGLMEEVIDWIRAVL